MPDSVNADESHWTVYTKDDGMVNIYTSNISLDHSGNIWVGHGGTDRGLSFYDGNAWQVYLSGYKYLGMALHVDRFNRILTSMVSAFIRYDGTNVDVFQPAIPERYGGEIRAIFVDDDDRIWVSGAGAPFTSAHIARYTNDEKDYQRFDYASCFTYDNERTLWRCGGDRIGYFISEEEGWYNYLGGVDFPIPDEIPYDISDMVFDNENILWAAFWGVGLLTYDGDTWSVYSPENSIIASRWVFSVTLDHNENLWIGTDAGACTL